MMLLSKMMLVIIVPMIGTVPTSLATAKAAA
jgi:hypothetical protein